MPNTLPDLYPKLLTHPELRELVQAHFGEQAAQILQGMADGSLGRNQSEELEEHLTGFILDRAAEVARFQGLGSSASSSREAMAYLKAHHPQAANLMQTQARELERLLGKDGAAAALGQFRQSFTIRVLHWGPVHGVVAEDFESAWFEELEEAVGFAQNNYEPFIKSAKSQEDV